MKNLMILLAFALVLTGCVPSQQDVTTPETDDTIDTSVTTEDLQNAVDQENSSNTDSDQEDEDVATEEKDPTSMYEKWAIPKEENWADQGFSYDRSDCFGHSGGLTYGGDLVSSLIVDEYARSKLKLNTYTPEYLIKLENRLATFTKKTRRSDFYSFYVCNLDKNLDIVGAYLWPQGRKFTRDRTDLNDAHLYLVNNGVVRDLKDVQIYDRTATGAETYPCRATLEGGKINWNCFMGLAPGEDGGKVGGSFYKYWDIALTGKILNVQEGVSFDNF